MPPTYLIDIPLLMAEDNRSLGIDLGSISLKAALLDSSGEVLFCRWRRVAGAPREAIAELLAEIMERFPQARGCPVGATGSGRELVKEMISAAPVNEITAQAAACAAFHPEVESIIEIGGQDSKLILLDSERTGAAKEEGLARRGGVAHFAMNELCAAGTGAFLDQQAARLGLSIEEFASLALESSDPVPIAGRCAVFAKSDMTHHQQEGRALPDIVAGLCEALARSYSSNMIRGRDLPRPVSFQGGVAANEGLARAFKRILRLKDDELVVPVHYRVMGAIGAAMIAAESCRGRTRPGALEKKPETRGPAEKPSPLVPPATRPIDPNLSSLGIDGVYLGVDIGSVSVKVAAVGPGGILHSDYRFSDGKPQRVLKEMMEDPRLQALEIRGAATTGSGRRFIGSLICADVVVNEITAQSRAATVLLPGVDTVVEIGGQDAKFIRLEDGRASYFAMNRVCAAGTGAFLQEQAARLCVKLDREFEDEAFASASPSPLGNRCTVFMDSDLVSHQQNGASKKDLCAGLAVSVVSNYLDKVSAGYPMGKRVLFLGGVSKNRAVVSALEAKLKGEAFTSSAGCISGALGAALVAFDERKAGRYGTSAVRLCAEALRTKQFTCEICSN
ncbi:MAG TPA: acyl-CoA dehydratase activase, partial [bacterium]|nr:acyl-CoA dehydratase activase [bacterium]